MPRKRRVGRPKKKRIVRKPALRTTRRWGRGIWSWIKDRAKSLWNDNKAMIKSKALSLANQAKDRAVNYLRSNRTLSTFARSRLPTKFGLNEKLADVINRQTGMGRKAKRKTKPKTTRTIRGRGFFDVLNAIGNTAKDIAMPLVVPIAQKMIASRFGGRKRKTVKWGGMVMKPSLYSRVNLMGAGKMVKRGRGPLGSLLGGFLPF